VSDIGAVKAEETDAEPGPFRGDDRDGVPVADALHLGDEGARGGGVGRSHKEDNAIGECS
jgi:hypothetical protein